MDSKDETIRQQADRIEELEAEAYKNGLWALHGVKGADGVIGKATRDHIDAQRKMRQLEQIIQQLQVDVSLRNYQLHTSIQPPTEEMWAERENLIELRPVLESGECCVVWINGFIWHKPDSYMPFRIAPLIFPGSLEEAQESIPHPLVTALGRIPELVDITRTVPGLSKYELLGILKILSLHYYKSGDGYDRERLRLFHEKLPQLAAHHREEFKLNREITTLEEGNLRRLFNKALKVAFANARARRSHFVKPDQKGVMKLTPGGNEADPHEF